MYSRMGLASGGCALTKIAYISASCYRKGATLLSFFNFMKYFIHIQKIFSNSDFQLSQRLHTVQYVSSPAFDGKAASASLRLKLINWQFQHLLCCEKMTRTWRQKVWFLPTTRYKNMFFYGANFLFKLNTHFKEQYK